MSYDRPYAQRVDPTRLQEVSKNTRSWLLGHLSALGYEFSLGPLEPNKEWQVLSIGGHSARVRIANGSLLLDRPDARRLFLPIRRRGRWCAMIIAAWIITVSERRVAREEGIKYRLEHERLRLEHAAKNSALVAKSAEIVSSFNLKNVTVVAADQGLVTLRVSDVDLGMLERLCKELSRNKE